MANNYRNQRDRGEGWFDRSNQYDNQHRYRDQEFGSFRNSNDRFRGMNQGNQNQNQNRNQGQQQNSWRSNDDFDNRNAGGYENSSDRQSGMFDHDNDWNNRYQPWDQN